MAINPLDKIYTPEHILNATFDRTNQVLGAEPIFFDGVSGEMKRQTYFASGAFWVNDLVEDGNITYVGMEDPDGAWVVEKLDKTSGLSVRYGTNLNNSEVTAYDDAWAARSTTLTYGTYSQAF